MKKNKKYKIILLTLAGGFFLFLIFLFSVNIYINKKIDEKQLVTFAHNFFYKRFHRAVKFDEIGIDLFANIYFKNFELSLKSDFNDNLILIKGNDVKLGLNLSDLFKGKLKINSFNFYQPTIILDNQFYEKYFLDIEIFLKKWNNKEDNILSKKIKLSFIDSKIIYSDQFLEKKSNIVISEADIVIKKDSLKVSYEILGTFRKNKSNIVDLGELKIEGMFFKDANKKNITKIEISDFDLSYLNYYIKKINPDFSNMTGSISAQLLLTFVGEKINLSGNIENNDLTSDGFIKKNKIVFINSNWNIGVDVDFDKTLKLFTFKKLKLYDGEFKIDSVFNLNLDKTKKNIKGNISTNNINLSLLSRSFTPDSSIDYGGFLKAKFDFNYSIKNNALTDLASEMKLKKFFFKREVDDNLNPFLSKMDLNLKIKDEKIKIVSSLNFFNSDFKADFTGNVKSWFPFKSNSILKINSNSIYLKNIFFLISTFTNDLYKNAYVDWKKGYNEIFFLEKPIGKFVNNNNLKINFNADNLKITQKAKLNNLSFLLQLERGVVTLKDFNLNGYNAKYSFSLDALFHTDYPIIKLKGDVANFDLQDFTNDIGSNINLKGTAFASIDFQVNGYRLYQLLENSRANFSLNLICDGFIKNNPFMKRVGLFLGKNGKIIDYVTISPKSFTLSIAQMNENFYVRNFSFTGEKLNFNTIGKYNYKHGLNLNMYLNYKNQKDRFESLPLKIGGELSNPFLKINKYREKSKLHLTN